MRTQLTVGLLAGIALLLTAAGGACFWLIARLLTAHFDETLLVHLSALSSATSWERGKVEVDVASSIMTEFRPGPDAWYFSVRDRTADTIQYAMSESLRGQSWQVAIDAGDETGVHAATLPDGRSGRVALRRFKPSIEVPDADEVEEAADSAAAQAPDWATVPDVIILVGRGDAELRRTIGQIGLLLLLTGGLITAGSAIIVRRCVAAGVAPLASLGEQVRGITADTLDVRVTSVASTPTELRPIVDRLNDLLGRLEESFAREKRFTSAAAHELRTPIAELRTLLEVCAARPRSQQEYVRTVEEAEAITIQLQHLVETLFILARQHAGNHVVTVSSFQDVDLLPLLAASCAKADALARQSDGRVQLEHADGPFVVSGDVVLVQTVLENLLRNAIEHGVGKPEVRAAIEHQSKGYVAVSVDNPIQPSCAERVERFFEPFWRADEARGDRSHLGLGLAVARSFAELMGGTLDAEVVSGQRLRMTLRLKARPANT